LVKRVPCSAPLYCNGKLAEKRFEQVRFRLTIALRCAGRAGILCPPGLRSQERAESANEVGESETRTTIR
jgi:hypothetical protein